MDEVIAKYPHINRCLTKRTITTKFAIKYFEDKNVICEQPDLAIKKLAKLRRLVEAADLSIFFYREDVVVGSELTKNTIDTAKKLNKEFIVFEYSYEN
jgi:sulfur relay (sulfurtransferase) complex TusBCD TusD component (DsrE family)